VTPDALIAQVADLRRLVNQLLERQRQPNQVPLAITQTSHGLSTGNVVRLSSGTYVKAQADSAANARWVGVVVVISDNVFLLYRPGMIIPGLTSFTAGARYWLDASTAGAVTTTEPTISAPVYDALSATVAQICTGGGGAAALAPTEDGTVFASNSGGTAGEWVRDLDLGQNATSKAGKLRVLSPNAAGVAVEIDGALVTASSKKLDIREIDICKSDGTAGKMLVLGSAAY
jgi:hypothetical protein